MATFIRVQDNSMLENEVEITLCQSEQTLFLGAEVGVEIKHVLTGIVVRSTQCKSQHLNKIAALRLLNDKLVEYGCYLVTKGNTVMEKPIYEINFEIAELLGLKTLKSHSGLGHIYLDNEDKTRIDYCTNWNDLMPVVQRLDISFAPPLKIDGDFYAQQYLREDNDFGVQVADKNLQIALAKCCLLVLTNI